MFAFFRRIYKIIRVILWMAWCVVLALPRTKKEKWIAIRGMTGVTRIWGQGILRALNVHTTVHGDPSAYDGGLLVSNHMGPIDIAVHAALYGVRFTPNSGIRTWPVLGWYVGMTHPIWINRASKLESQKNLEEFKETLEHKVPLIVYPEGTTTDGNSLLPFKSSPFEVAVSGNFSVQPMVVIYRVPEGADSPCWYTDASILEHVWTLLGIPRIDCDVYILDPVKSEGMSRKELAQHVRDIIVQEHTKRKAELKEQKTC